MQKAGFTLGEDESLLCPSCSSTVSAGGRKRLVELPRAVTDMLRPLEHGSANAKKLAVAAVDSLACAAQVKRERARHARASRSVNALTSPTQFQVNHFARRNTLLRTANDMLRKENEDLKAKIARVQQQNIKLTAQPSIKLAAQPNGGRRLTAGAPFGQAPSAIRSLAAPLLGKRSAQSGPATSSPAQGRPKS